MKVRNSFKLSHFHKRGIDITPLIDVMFIVLSFLIVSANFRQEGAFDIDLPKAKLSKNIGKKNKNVLYVKKEGLFLGNKKIKSEEELKIEIAKRNIKVLEIRGDRSIPYERIIKIMDIAIASNVEKLMLTTEKE